MRYAIGEILLVVVGILIALQINNWNEARQSKTIEVSLLKDFKKGLEFDISQIDSIKIQYSRAKRAINNILEHMNKDLPYSKELDTAFFNTTLIFDSGGLTLGLMKP